MKTIQQARQDIRQIEDICLQYRGQLEELSKKYPKGINFLDGYNGPVYEYIEQYDPIEVTLLSGSESKVLGLMPSIKGHTVAIRCLMSEEGVEASVPIGDITPCDFVYIYAAILDYLESDPKEKLIRAIETYNSEGRLIVNSGLLLGIPLDNIESSYMGRHNSDEDFADYIVSQMGYNTSEFPFTSMNWEHAGQCVMSNHVAYNNHYFNI